MRGYWCICIGNGARAASLDDDDNDDDEEEDRRVRCSEDEDGPTLEAIFNDTLEYSKTLRIMLATNVG